MTEGDTCPLCKAKFFGGERIVLAPVREPLEGWENVPAIPVHARCALKGARCKVGIVDHVKDGDSPYPIVTEDGKQHRIEEAGFDE